MVSKILIKYKIWKYFIFPILGTPRLKILYKFMEGKQIRILDIGCGNHSAQLTKKVFPLCKYYGIDKELNYENSEKDYCLMENFWLLDIEKSNMKEVPDNYFDILIFSHVIEHLKYGKEVLIKLTHKLKKKGILYVEFPSYHTQFLPSLKKIGVTFNFFDDMTHKRIYQKREIIKILTEENFLIKSAKIFFNWKKIIILPFLILYHFSKNYVFCFYELWEFIGWSTYIIAIKK